MVSCFAAVVSRRSAAATATNNNYCLTTAMVASVGASFVFLLLALVTLIAYILMIGKGNRQKE
jgi:hypothetical protein